MADSRRPAQDSVNEICTIRIELNDTDPPIWREVEVPTSITLLVLHDIIQIAMGWFDCHLWEFTIHGERYGIPNAEDWEGPAKSAAKTRLRSVLNPRRTRIDYLYDYGDSWEHRLTVSRIRQGDPAIGYPRMVRGERAGPPEDCGGIPGFEELLEALRNPEHPEHEEMSEYYEGYDPDEIGEIQIGYALSRLANRRNAAKKRAGKRQQLGPQV